MKKITFIATALLLSMSSFAQQALFDNVPVVSPEVNANHTVTFRLKAPNAQKVQITGDFQLFPGRRWKGRSLQGQQGSAWNRIKGLV